MLNYKQHLLSLMNVNLFALHILAWLIGPLVCRAQSTTPFRFGLIGGINASQINTPSLKTTSGLLWQYGVGVTAEQRFSPRISLVSELKYSHQGSRSKAFGLLGDDVNVSKYNYLTLPIFVRYQPKGERVFIELGGQVGYFLGGQNYFNSRKDRALALQNVTPLDVGLVGGLGYRLSTHFVADVRYYHGLRRIREDFTAPDPVTGIPTSYLISPQYHRVWSLNLSYFF